MPVSVITIVLATLVALEHFYIMYLETFATTSATTARVFGMTTDELSRTSVTTLFKNQGVYNGLLAVLLLVSLFIAPSELFVQLLLGYVILVAAYGSITSSPKIILTQGGLAILALVSSLVL